MNHDETPSVPDPLASFDQALRAFKDVAMLMRNYFVSLVETGFTEPQALQLTVAYQTTWLASANTN